MIKHMRTFMLFLFTAVALIGCEDTETNNPAMQASLNDELYRATDARAEINPNGSVVIQGITDLETLTLTLSGTSEGVYTLGGEGTNRAVFEDFMGSVYTTRPFGDGEVVLENSSDNTLTGSFNFNAYRFGLDTLNARAGYFYRVPIIAGSTNEEPNEDQSILTATIDGADFDATSISAVDSGNFLLITGTSDDQSISLSFPNTLTNGNNPIGGDIAASYTNDGTVYEAVSGNISIVNHNTTLGEISGAFSFETEGPEGIIISQGQFNVSY